MKLRNDELLGEEVTQDDVTPVVVNGRKLVGVSIPSNDLVFCSHFSVLLKQLETHDIIKEVLRNIPDSLIARKEESKETMCAKMEQCLWLDEIWKNRNIKPLNGDITSKQACWQTVSVCIERSKVIMGAEEEENIKRCVPKMYVCSLLLENVQEFYTDTPTLRSAGRMLKYSKN